MARLRPIVDARGASSLPLELKTHALRFLSTDNLVHPAAVSKAWRAAAMMDDRFVLHANFNYRDTGYYKNSHPPFFDVIEHAIRFGRRLSIDLATCPIDRAAPQDAHVRKIRVAIEAIALAMHLVVKLNISIFVDLPYNLFDVFCQAQAPSLRSLRISSYSSEAAFTVPTSLFSGHAPRLETVELLNSVLAEPVSAFRTARHLHIFIEGDYMLPPHPFELGKTFPSLRRLKFIANEFDGREDSPEGNLNIGGLRLDELCLMVVVRGSEIDADDIAADRLVHIPSVTRGHYEEINLDIMRELLNAVGSGNLSLNISQPRLDCICVALTDITGHRRAAVGGYEPLSEYIYLICPHELSGRLTSLIIECDHAHTLHGLPNMPVLLQLDIRVAGRWDFWESVEDHSGSSDAPSPSEMSLSGDDTNRNCDGESDASTIQTTSLERRSVDIEDDSTMPAAAFPALELLRIVAVGGQCNVSVAVIRCLAEVVSGRRCRLELHGVIGISSILFYYEIFKDVELFPERISPVLTSLEHIW
ncbi:hypothetical protein BKA62DRAFT_834277 [Auriculariales sp. MPI-PUGE-AT-0066]|nr:hypothetical protein BKA62DRAFT_834277 [Auriculariales sp. MPI-PUGE-AT-0066]